MITKDNFLAVIRSELPNFSIDKDWAEGNLGYPIINDLARYICAEAMVESYDEVKKAVSLLHSLSSDGNAYIKELVRECIETLIHCEKYTAIRPFLNGDLRDISKTLEPNPAED